MRVDIDYGNTRCAKVGMSCEAGDAIYHPLIIEGFVRNCT